MLSSAHRKLVKTISIERFKYAKKNNEEELLGIKPDFSDLKVGDGPER
jgi:hypothetical protein